MNIILDTKKMFLVEEKKNTNENFFKENYHVEVKDLFIKHNFLLSKNMTKEKKLLIKFKCT